MDNGNITIGTAQDFQRYARDNSWSEPKPVVLPKSGIAVLLRQPTELYQAVNQAHWPEQLRNKIEDSKTREQLASVIEAEELEILNADRRRMLEQAFVEPKISLVPGDEMFNVSLLPKEDREFIFDYLRGEIDASGVSLETFSSRQQKPSGDSGGAGK